MLYTDDPLADFDKWDAVQTKRENGLPCCVDCGEHIHQEDAVHMDGFWYCDSCIDSYRRTVNEE